MRENFIASLKRFTDSGWKVIPVVVFESVDQYGMTKREKHPLVDWKTFQNRFPTKEELNSWAKAPFADFAGVEVLTGLYDDNLYVCGIDFDQRDGQPDFEPFIEDLASVMRTKTASGGYHFYYQSTQELRNKTNIFSGDKSTDDTIVDFRGQGGVMVVGDTPLWSEDPRYSKSTAKILASYSTENICSPQDLNPLPDTFLVAMRSLETVGEKKWRQIFSAEGRTAPRHDIIMSMVGKLLVGVTKAEDIEAARHLVHSLAATQFGDRFNTKDGKDEIDRMFTYSLERQKSSRTSESQVAKQAIEQTSIEEWSDNLKTTRCEFRGDIVTFFGEDNRKFSIPAKDRFNESTFRNLHHLTWGVLLPTIPKKQYELILSKIPVETISNQSTTLEEIVEDILHEFISTSSPEENQAEARSVAARRDSGWFEDEDRSILFFRLKALIPKLREEGVMTKRPDLTAALRSVDAERIKTNSCNLWKYEMARDSSEESV